MDTLLRITTQFRKAFLLFLGPFIARVTLFAYECESLDFAVHGKDAYVVSRCSRHSSHTYAMPKKFYMPRPRRLCALSIGHSVQSVDRSVCVGRGYGNRRAAAVLCCESRYVVAVVGECP